MRAFAQQFDPATRTYACTILDTGFPQHELIRLPGKHLVIHGLHTGWSVVVERHAQVTMKVPDKIIDDERLHKLRRAGRALLFTWQKRSSPLQQIASDPDCITK